ncbi:MAG TPA: XrtA/PEP-CTERM system histidine kinase PrsK [Candidatus Acidoferrum sp.]|nr:XrtA/PEP-CTERM system histidine kinase PrsK [Candidatus Acidoferrum sp.]
MTAPAALEFASALSAASLALTLVLQQRRTAARWAFAAGMLGFAAESICAGLAAGPGEVAGIARWQRLAFMTLAILPGPWLLFSVTYARGNAREFLARWQIVIAAAFLAPIALAVLCGDETISALAEGTSSAHLIVRLGFCGMALNLMFLLSAVMVLMNLERTFRAAVGTMRWRIKFVVLGLGVLFVARVYTGSQALLFHGGDLMLQSVNAGALLLGCVLMLYGVLRAGLSDVSVYPSQSLLHRSLTAVVAGVYLLLVGVLAKVVAVLGGDASFPVTAFLVLLALVGLAMLLLSDRVRLVTRRFVSRHFQRPIYDYRTVWRTFTEGTTRCVEQGELCGAVVKLVSEVFQALSVTIWLATDRKDRLNCAASTFLSREEATKLSLEATDAAEVITALRAHPEPLDIDASKELWAAALRRSNPVEFRKGGNRVCAPLIAGGELLGLLVLGDRVGAVPYTVQDLDLLKCVSEQAAASLLNIELSQKLSQSKQLEAFQAMSAFFVHDLKNTASTLSLMLQNLPVHYQDPQFREDALRGISKTVTHINEIIGRLTELRHELALRSIECDLNDLVVETLKAQDSGGDVRFRQELRPLPKIRVDPAQIRKVITNLVLNARDAVPSGGEIRVETSRNNGWVVLAVADNGCGMTSEFIQRSLFRPFQTTKRKGIGIGMFHCKMIVEAHRGRIEVESAPGKGTAFRVFLPVSSS